MTLRQKTSKVKLVKETKTTSVKEKKPKETGVKRKKNTKEEEIAEPKRKRGRPAGNKNKNPPRKETTQGKGTFLL